MAHGHDEDPHWATRPTSWGVAPRRPFRWLIWATLGATAFQLFCFADLIEALPFVQLTRSAGPILTLFPPLTGVFFLVVVGLSVVDLVVGRVPHRIVAIVALLILAAEAASIIHFFVSPPAWDF
jgi:hypothetical protein